MRTNVELWSGRRGAILVLLALGLALTAGCRRAPVECGRSLTAEVVALDQIYFWNRLGAVQPQGMVYALRRDVVSLDGGRRLVPGKVVLREDRRPRPLVLRMNEGDCLEIEFQNLLAPAPVDQQQPATRDASIHVVGLQLVESIRDAGINLGRNREGGTVAPGETITYHLHAEHEGTYLMYSTAAMVGGNGDGGSISAGLFGAVNVEPAGSEWYRSQVTEEDLRLATTEVRDGFPVIDYEREYPRGHRFAGLPILRMLDRKGRIVHSDLTAIVTGRGRGKLEGPGARSTPVYPNRADPFREYTIIFHDEIGAVQAFPEFQDPVLAYTLESVRDAFAINYGTGGIGAEILANRLGVGPMAPCVECKYEEFFLSSWVVGDPAMVVDVPANAPCSSADLRAGKDCQPRAGAKATKAFYPDDPSNVYHSYLGDRVKFRNLHAGTDDHHIFHLHAHQWLHTPLSDVSAYHDSQAIGQSGAFTYEIAYNGGGNRNKTVGDSIFHCHFYPHFAQGMWALWRVHDVLETGTPLDGDGRPVEGGRALPDGEIARGTPIPAVVPLPGLPLAPLPGEVSIADGQARLPSPLERNPGFPFFIPGRAGHRPPHPPLDTLDDGGLPRHLIVAGEAEEVHNRLDFSKELLRADAVPLAEEGEPVEKLAMAFHARAEGWATPLPDGDQPGGASSRRFRVNGAPPAPGAPFADPCIDDRGVPIDLLRRYRAADIQLDVILSKAGWHFPQQRILTLWDDVADTLAGRRPPEPLFIRANSGECVEYQLANLVPNVYQLDDFQVRTPTDVLGQHIHLVKFDVTSSDGSANGWNYEDGSFSPEEVRERIRAIRAGNGCAGDETRGGDPRDGSFECPVAKPHPRFGAGPDGDWLGAQTTIQRWWVDPVLDLEQQDRTLHTVFTHDHLGPSTHQQAGLYAGLVVEPAGSEWFHNESGERLGTRASDGGPTSWQAVIAGSDPGDTYREFMLQLADFQLAYDAESVERPSQELGWADPKHAINPPARKSIGPPFLFERPDRCPVLSEAPHGAEPPDGVEPPCPEAVSADDPGMTVINYRAEPLALRIRDPDGNRQAAGRAGDLSWAYASTVDRADDRLDVQPDFYPPLTRDLAPGDPFTPILRSYEGDEVKVRILAGAHEEEHAFNAYGVKWLFEPDDPDSGFRSSQMLGISEYFDFSFGRIDTLFEGRSVDLLYKGTAAAEWQWNGAWGLMRVYRGERKDLFPLPINEDCMVRLASYGTPYENQPRFCPEDAPLVEYDVTAIAAAEALPDGTLSYNPRTSPVSHPDGTSSRGPLHDPTAILFVPTADLEFVSSPEIGGAGPRLRAGAPIEPLVLRARAGDCIEVTLRNLLPRDYRDLDGWNGMPNILDHFNANQVAPSLEVGLHPSLVFHDPREGDGTNVGRNQASYPAATAAPGKKRVYRWYAGETRTAASGELEFLPIELGTVGLVSSDPIKHSNKGAVGALVIEPAGARWDLDDGTRAAATVTLPGGAAFREFVVLFQDDVNLRYAGGDPVASLIFNEDATESAQKAFNYRTDPIWFRMGHAPETPGEETREKIFTRVLENAFVGGDPATPVFTARAGTPVRFRVVHPAGHTQAHVFEVHGHVWQEEPYVDGSRALGHNPASNWGGTRDGVGPSIPFDALLEHGAGGRFGVPGDYLYRDYVAWSFDNGSWGIFRVLPRDDR